MKTIKLKLKSFFDKCVFTGGFGWRDTVTFANNIPVWSINKDTRKICEVLFQDEE